MVHVTAGYYVGVGVRLRDGAYKSYVVAKRKGERKWYWRESSKISHEPGKFTSAKAAEKDARATLGVW